MAKRTKSGPSVTAELSAPHGSRIRKADLPTLAAEFDRIERRDGGTLTPEAVVAEARKPRSVFHKYFEWDVDKAAAAHWIRQAQNLIYQVRINVTYIDDPDYQPTSIRLYTSVTDRDTGVRGYANVVRVMSDAELRLQSLNEARDDFLRLKKKYQDLLAFESNLGESLDACVKLLTSLRRSQRRKVSASKKKRAKTTAKRK